MISNTMSRWFGHDIPSLSPISPTLFMETSMWVKKNNPSPKSPQIGSINYSQMAGLWHCFTRTTRFANLLRSLVSQVLYTRLKKDLLRRMRRKKRCLATSETKVVTWGGHVQKSPMFIHVCIYIYIYTHLYLVHPCDMVYSAIFRNAWLRQWWFEMTCIPFCKLNNGGGRSTMCWILFRGMGLPCICLFTPGDIEQTKKMKIHGGSQ